MMAIHNIFVSTRKRKVETFQKPKYHHNIYLESAEGKSTQAVTAAVQRAMHDKYVYFNHLYN